MSRPKRKASPSRLRHSLFIWHRYIGISVALVVVILSLTGLLLNHTETFKLDEKKLKSNILLDWYGLKLSPPTNSFKSGSHWVSQIEEQLYLDTRPLPHKNKSPLIGVVKTDGFIVIAFSLEIVLITNEGELIERITPAEGLPANIYRIGLNNLEQPVIDSSSGILYSTDGLLSWENLAVNNTQWSAERALPKQLSEEISHHFRQNIIPLERFILDLHSGRIFGVAGVFFVDVATLLFIFLAFSGFWLWLRQRRHYKRKK